MSVQLAIPLLLFAISGSAQRSSDPEALQQAKAQFASHNYPSAEKNYRAYVTLHPEDLTAQIYLGHTLFREEKYAEAIGPYEAARRLERNSGVSLPLPQHRVLADQLTMTYGVSGRTDDARALLLESIRTDPRYALNYYNLACADADANHKEDALANLKKAFDPQREVLSGEHLPDPRTDSSFKKYLADPFFQALVASLAFN